MTFSEQLKKQRGILNQEAAAIAADCDLPTYKAWERGVIIPPPSRCKMVLAKLSKVASTPLTVTWDGLETSEQIDEYLAAELSLDVFFPPGVQARVANRLGKPCPNQTESYETADYVRALWRERNQASEDRVEEIDLELERIALLVDGPLLEPYNADGSGDEEHDVYRVPILSEDDYWRSVTDVPCPIPGCGQWVVWYEAGYVPGYRVCMAAIERGGYDVGSLRHRFMASGTAADPKLILL